MIQEEEDIKAGTLYHRDGGIIRNQSWHERWFVLNGSNLYWFKNAKEAVGPMAKKKRARGFITLTKGVRIRLEPDLDPPCNDSPFKERTFQIHSNGQVVTLSAPTKESFGDWVHVLESTIAGRKDLNRETVIITEELRRAEFDIPADDLEFEQSEDDLVGAGASGIVRKGKWLKTTEVAVKALKNLPEFTDSKEMTLFYKEIETLSKLRHANIVQMFGFCRKDNYLCLITEYVRGGNLSQCLQNPAKFPLDFDRILNLSLNIVRGMVFLHHQGVIHRDLKPANILIENWMEAKVKVCDFGISRVMKTKVSDSTKDEDAGMGSPQYAAPELKNDHDSKVDVFSFGIILWELAMGEMPWPEVKFGWEFAERYERGERPYVPPDCLFGFLIKKCWQAEPHQRPSFQQVYKDLEVIQQGPSGRLKSHTVSGPHQSPPLSVNTFATRSVMVARPHNGSPVVKAQSSPILTAVRVLPTPPVGRLGSPPNQRGGIQRSPTTGSINNIPGVRAALGRSSPGNSTNSSPLSSPHFNGPEMPHYGSLPVSPPNSLPSSPLSSPHFNGPEMPHYGSLPISPPNSQPTNSVEAAVNKLFENKNVEAWTVFVNTLVTSFATSNAQVDKLRYIFDTRQGGVEKSTWQLFLQWFSPLSGSNTYHSPNVVDANGGYELDTILSICSADYFHGFMDSKDAQRILKGKPEGTFLLRFSTQQPGFYTLSVSYSGTVGHWRIACEKRPHQQPVFKIDTRAYQSLEDVVNTHRSGRDPLKIKQPKPGQPDYCFLTSAYVRPDAADSYYQVI